MADISKINLPNDNTTYDIVSKTGRGLIRCETDSTSTATAFVVDVPGVTELYEGLTISIKNTAIASASGCTINVNGLGAKSIWLSLSNALLTTQWALNTEYLFVYDTTNDRWVIQQGYNTNDDVKAYTVYRQYTGYKSGEISVFTNTLIMQRPNGTWESIVTSSSTELDKTPNPHGFLLYDILYWSGTTVAPNSVIGTNNLVDQVTSRVDMRYSFNIDNSSATGFATYAPVYIVGTLGNDGLFYLDNPWWTQTLPSTEDGKLYIYIGNSYDRYHMPFIGKHPIYRYTNGMIRQYIPDAATVGGETIDEHFLSNDLTGNIVSFTTNYADLPLKKCILHIPVTQTGSGTPSPDNIRDIVGVQGVNIGQTSGYGEYFKGLLNGTYGFVDLGDLEWTYTSATTRFYTDDITDISLEANFTNMLCSIYDVISSAVSFSNMPDKSIKRGVSGAQISIRDLGYTDASLFTTAVTGQYLIYELAEPSTPVTPEQFATLCQAFGITGNTYSISFGQTVYSANLDVLNGKLSITHILDLFDGSEDENWTVYGTGTENFFYRCPTSQTAENGKPSCNRFTPESIFPTGTRLGVYVYGSQVRIRTDNELSLTDWKAFLSSNNVQVVYELAEPIEIQLTPTQIITTLIGENVIFADVGTLDIQFIKSTVPWADTSASAQTVNGHTVAKNVPSDALFTDTKSDWNATSGNAQILNKPTLGTAAAKDIPTSGNASTTQVVMGNDSRLTNARTPTSHTHGNIQNDGTLQTTDVTIANGDKLVVTDSSNSNKAARASITFDGSTTTKCLTQKGTWEDFGNGAVTGVKGKTESTYSTGNVNITPAKVGAVDLEGDTMSGNLRIERTDPTNNAVVYLGNTNSTGINQYLLYNNGHSAAIRPETSSILTDDRKLYIPDKSGTIATIDDITPYYVLSTLDTSTNVANSTQVDKPPNVQVTSAGVYLVIAHVQFAQNANGIRELRITQSRSNSVIGISTGTTGPASNVTNSSISESYIFLANKNDTFGLRLYQSSGGTLAATWRELQVYRLSPMFMS